MHSVVRYIRQPVTVVVLADESATAEEILSRASARFGESVVFTTAIDLEGSVIASMISRAALPIRIVTIDTGLLFPQTYETWRQLEDGLDIKIEGIQPVLTLEAQAAEHGPQLWTSRPDQCCGIRKVEPLQRVLTPAEAWITGIRRDQTPERADAPKVGEDARFDVTKINPLADWTLERVQDYLHTHRVPYNPMFDDGYPSIGCEPCTRRVNAGEDPRAGRWSGFQKRECGLHFETGPDGVAVVKRGQPS